MMVLALRGSRGGKYAARVISGPLSLIPKAADRLVAAEVCFESARRIFCISTTKSSADLARDH